MENTSLNPFETEALPRKVMPLIFMVDTSGSMDGAKIASVNTAIREVLDDIDEISQNNGDSIIKVAVLAFSSGCQWLYPTPLEASQFQWQDMEAYGLTSFGMAIDELNTKLSASHGFMGEPTGTRAPAIILLSDGEPTDNYVTALGKLKRNNWFNYSVKVAIAVGDDADKDVLADFVGSLEGVITVHNAKDLKKIIRTVSVTASKVTSMGASVGTEGSDEGSQSIDSQDQTTTQIKDAIDSDPTLEGVDMGSSDNNKGTDDWGNW